MVCVTDDFDIERRILALKHSLEDLLKDELGRNAFPRSEVASFFRDYAEIRKELQLRGWRYAGVPVCRDEAYLEGYDSSKNVRRTNVEALMRGVNHALNVLPDTIPVSQILRKEGFFFRGQSFEALLATTHIIDSAKSSVDLVDGYTCPATLGLMRTMKDKAQIRILTWDVEDKDRFVTLAQAYISDGGRLEVRLSHDFHDRFVIIDDEEFYHFGASLKGLGKRGFMYSRIEEPKVIEAVRKSIQDVWSNAEVVVPASKPGARPFPAKPPAS